MKEDSLNPFLTRYSPTCRMSSISKNTKYVEKIKQRSEDFGVSITDKESYRLSLQGQGLGGAVSVSSGSFMFPDGKYDSNKDISFVLRPDLSPVQIDEYIDRLRSRLESADEELKSSIEQAISQAEAVKSVTPASSDGSSAPSQE